MNLKAIFPHMLVCITLTEFRVKPNYMIGFTESTSGGSSRRNKCGAGKENPQGKWNETHNG